jgi:outer membrane protein
MNKTLKGAAVALCALATGTAQADTLREALVAAYTTNPTLTGARAPLRATDEGVPIARAQGLPSAQVVATHNEFVQRSTINFTSPKRDLNATGSLTVPLYQGGQVSNAVRAAKTRVEAGRQDLRSTEAGVFQDATGAYMDVIRDQSIVDLNKKNVSVLETNLQASSDRFQAGDLTRTDVAQSDARLAVARGQLETAQAQLDASAQNYLRVIGRFPAALEAPPPLPAFPATTDDTVDVAVANNPALEAAKKASKAADYDVRAAQGLRLPQLSAFAQGTYDNFFNSLNSGIPGETFPQHDKTGTVGARLTIPLYQGGLPSARVREAQAHKGQAIEQVTAIERQVVADARTAFSRYEAALYVIQSS